MVFKGSGECADVVWSFLGLSMPSWVVDLDAWPRSRRRLE